MTAVGTSGAADGVTAAAGGDGAPGGDPVAFTPGGWDGDVAITWAGDRITYGDLAAEIGSAPTGTPLDISALPVPQAVVCALAAARAGTSVLVRDPAATALTADASPGSAALPTGTWLVAATSGSTGRPRAICRTTRSWARSVAPLARIAGLTRADRVLLTGPLHATLHLHAALHTLAIGAELTDEPARASAVHAVPAVLADLLDSLGPAGPLRTAVVAGSALPEALAGRCARRGVAVTEYYGAAELSFVAARRLPDPMLRPFPGVEVRLGGDGVLWARSPYLALGYAGADAGPLRRDADGYATVGDLAAAPGGDAEGGLLIRGRGDSAVSTGGSTVLVEDVEAALAGLPGVRAAAVIGLPHARLGEVVTAVVELAPGADIGDVRRAARRVLSGPARPRRYLVMGSIPRTGGGKVARAALRRALRDAT